MVDIKCFSLLLVLIFLLLLVISCGSEIKTGEGTNTGAGTEEGTGPEEEVGDEDELAYLDDEFIDPSFIALLDKFGVSGEGRKAIGYILGKVDNIEKINNDDVYDRLNELGADITIKNIINPTVSLLKARGAALKGIEDPTNESIKSRLQDMFEKCDRLSALYLWEFFGRLIEENDFLEFITRCIFRFRKLKEMVNNPRVMDVYEWFDADDRATIDELGNMVISGTYYRSIFNKVLNNSGDYLVIKIVVAYQSIQKRQEEALKAIAIVRNEAVRQVLQNRFDKLKGDYDFHIRKSFNQGRYGLYLQIMTDGKKYREAFNAIQKAAQVARSDKARGATGSGS
ncbi:hypothetical protein bpSLO_001160 (plasmid) [Borrelia parkeri]|uniref:BTA121 domain-containing protein surface lipoprotein n=1 Tax=Borrelia parkeri TaxID=141 RepID=UPI001FF20BE4|nr:hypothetical protein [Borrelia parkeri]UPA11307.1 hypothetical protein bpSLO_001160 [Borrelia parkeri]